MSEDFKYYLNGTEYEVIKKKRITGELVDSFKEIFRKIPRDSIVMLQYDALKEAENTDITTNNLEFVKKLFNKGLTNEQVYDFVYQIPQIDEAGEKVYYELMQLLTDIELMPEEIKVELKKPIEKNLKFWKNQDIKLKEEVDFFRSKHIK